MTASAWRVDRKRSEWPPERLIDHTARVQAYNPSRRSPSNHDLRIGSTSVELLKTGRGWLWRCPKCQALALHLYTLDEVMCRHCARLDYSCRHVSRDMPEVARIVKMRQRLGADLRPFGEIPPRRKWQRRLPRLRLLKRLAELEDQLTRRMTRFADDLERRARVRGLKP